MSTSIEHCREEEIGVLQGRGARRYKAHTYGDFAAFEMAPGFFGLVHVPSGMLMGTDEWGEFRSLESACEAMVEINGLRNTWAFMDDADWLEVADDFHRIATKHGGANPLMAVSIESAYPNTMNGYDEMD